MAYQSTKKLSTTSVVGVPQTAKYDPNNGITIMLFILASDSNNEITVKSCL